MAKDRASAIVLLSSGLDSTVNLYKASTELNVIRVLTIDYGQKAAPKEIQQSQIICQGLGLEHEVIELPWLKKISSSSLTDEERTIPTGLQVNINDVSVSKETAKSVWVPNRNGVLLNVAAAYADALGAEYIIPGFNKEEAQTFPDNSLAFMTTIDAALAFSTRTHSKIKCYTVDMDKTEIVKMGRQLNVPFDHIWPCYFAGEKICGQCESCQRYINALK